MVDISGKSSTLRVATAEGRIQLSSRALEMVLDPGSNPKGSVMNVAQLASIMAVKKTADLIPLCHSLSVSGIDVKVLVEDKDVIVRVSVKSVGETGVEMEALTGVSVGLLTIYDMTKSVSHEHVITNIRLLSKMGGMRNVSNVQ